MLEIKKPGDKFGVLRNEIADHKEILAEVISKLIRFSEGLCAANENAENYVQYLMNLKLIENYAITSHAPMATIQIDFRFPEGFDLRIIRNLVNEEIVYKLVNKKGCLYDNLIDLIHDTY
jgi:hypothetical protein